MALSGQTGRNYRYRFDVNKPADSVIDAGSWCINYSVNELVLEEVENESGLFYRVTIPGHTPTYDAGDPEVPVLSQMVTIPEGADVRIKISEVKTVRLHPSSQNIRGIIYPSQESESKSLMQRRKEFVINRESYNSTQLLSLDTVKIESIGQFRGTRISNITIYPVRYNPKTNSIEVITSMKIEITNVSPINSESLQNANTFALGQITTSNLKDMGRGFSDKPIGMVILTDTVFKDHLTPFIKWKRQKGFNVTVLYRGKNYAGESYSEIKSTLETIYKLSPQPPDYLLIIGDVEKIPTQTIRYGSVDVVTDLYYGEFSGNGDYIPEMFIGRLPVSNTAQLDNVINKIIQYEKFQFAPNANFYSRALITAGNDPYNYNTMNGHIFYAVNNYLNNSNNLTGYSFSYPQSSNPDVADLIRNYTREGLSFINYTGHGEIDGWVEPNLRSGDLDTVSNTGMYPFIISNACKTSNFSSASAFGNKMVLSLNKGAIGFIGGSEDTYWNEDYYWAVGAGNISTEPAYSGKELGAYDRLFHTHGEPPSEWYYTMGQITFAGNMSVSASTSNQKRYYWEVYNLVGDPSVIPIIGKPEPFKTQIPDVLPSNIKTMNIVGEPFSYIAVSNFDTIWDASFVSASGAVELTLPEIKSDSCLFVITGQNKIPLIKTVRLGPIIDEYLNLEGYSINDINGNNNQLAENGERIYLAVKIENYGYTAANNVYAKISTSSDLITINKDSTFIGSINFRSRIELTDKLEFTVRDNIADNSIATIELTLASSGTIKKYIINIPIHAPKLQTISCILDDSAFGNGDKIIDPGERVQFIYKIQNSGSSYASGVFSVFTFNTDKITVIDRNVNFTVKAGETIEIPVTVQVSSSAGVGDYFNLNSTLTYGAYIVQNTYEFRVGKVREGFETGAFNIFPWINVSRFPWTITSGNVYEGNFSARSGAIGNSSSSSLYIRTFYSTNDSIKFMYNVSSEAGYDFLVFKINNKEVLRESGETGWKQFSGQVKAGLNSFEWSYIKDPNQSVGMDCAWIDKIDFTTTGSLRYIERDLEVARVVPPPPKNSYSMEPITVKLMYLGRDTIYGFRLAYTINESAPVQQTFVYRIMPQLRDTVTVEFFEKYDFSNLDRYNITVYAFNNNDDYSRNDTASYLFIKELADSLIIYPNPFTDRFTVYINSRYSDMTTISMFDLSGKKVYETKVSISEGKNQVIINTPWLSPAVYIVNIRNNRKTHSLRVVKIRR